MLLCGLAGQDESRVRDPSRPADPYNNSTPTCTHAEDRWHPDSEVFAAVELLMHIHDTCNTKGALCASDVRMVCRMCAKCAYVLCA